MPAYAALSSNSRFPPPNYVDPETRPWTASAFLIALSIVTIFIFTARIWARFRITHTPGWDDWLIMVSMPILLGQTIVTVLALRIYGFQHHIYDLKPSGYITLRQTALAMSVLYIATTTVTKISILTFYRRMSSSALNSVFLVIVWTSIIFVALYGIISILLLMFTCSPVKAYWYRSSKEWTSSHKFKCREELLSVIAIVTISTLQDFIACLLPMSILRKLRLPLRQKLALHAIFGMGLGTCALGVFRVFIAVKHLKLRSVPTYDATWDTQGAWTATCVEANLGVICASAPALKAYCRCLESRHQDRGFGWYHRAVRTTSSSGTGTIVPMKTWRFWVRGPEATEVPNTV